MLSELVSRARPPSNPRYCCPGAEAYTSMVELEREEGRKNSEHHYRSLGSLHMSPTPAPETTMLDERGVREGHFSRPLG